MSLDFWACIIIGTIYSSGGSPVRAILFGCLAIVFVARDNWEGK